MTQRFHRKAVVAMNSVVAFTVTVTASAISAAVGFVLCRRPFVRSRKLLVNGTPVSGRIIEVVPKFQVGQEFPSDSARIVVEYDGGGSPRRETIVLSRTTEEHYRPGDKVELLIAAGRPLRARTREEPNIRYGTAEQIVGAVLLIAAALPYFIMLSAQALTP